MNVDFFYPLKSVPTVFNNIALFFNFLAQCYVPILGQIFTPKWNAICDET